MIPVLFNKTATDFTSYGIGALSDTISCVVTEERNGLYELEMQYPTSGIHFSEIENSAIILAKPNESQNAQAFRIYQIESPIDEVCTIRAEHISYQLNHIPVDCFSATGISDAFVKLKQYSLTQNPFTFYTDKTSQSSFQNKLPKSARALLGGEAGSFLQKFKGEYLWDNWTVSLLNARGSDNGVVLRYGKNITDFNKDENYSDTVTGICPYWTNEGTVLVGDITKVNTTLPYDRVEVMDVSSDIELPDEGEGVVAPTKAQVTAAGAQELNNKSYVGVPATNITISFVALWQTEEYKDIAPLESVGLCDTVTVIYEKYGVSKKEKVIKTVYDTLLERYNEIEIGDPHYNLATSFASVLATVEDTNDHILLEVSRRKEGDEAMSAKIELTAEEIRSTVAGSQKEWDTTGYNITLYGYELPADEGYPASDFSGRYYLNQTDGKVYYSNGSTWTYISQLSSVQASVESSISQKMGSITLSVSNSTDSSTITLSGTGIVTQSKTIKFTGDVIFASDLTDGITTISGSNIKTGSISADRISGGTLSGITISGATITSAQSIESSYSCNAQEFIGGGLTLSGGIISRGTRTSHGSTDDYFVRVQSDGAFVYTTGAGTSSRRYKHDIQDVTDPLLDPHKILDIPVRQFEYNPDTENRKDEKGHPVIGLIAEEVNEHYPRATIFSSYGMIENWDERYIIPPMLALIQEQHKEIESLKERI